MKTSTFFMMLLPALALAAPPSDPTHGDPKKTDPKKQPAHQQGGQDGQDGEKHLTGDKLQKEKHRIQTQFCYACLTAEAAKYDTTTMEAICMPFCPPDARKLNPKIIQWLGGSEGTGMPKKQDPKKQDPKKQDPKKDPKKDPKEDPKKQDPKKDDPAGDN